MKNGRTIYMKEKLVPARKTKDQVYILKFLIDPTISVNYSLKYAIKSC